MKLLPLRRKLLQEPQHSARLDRILGVEQLNGLARLQFLHLPSRAQRRHTLQPPFLVRYSLQCPVAVRDQRLLPAILCSLPLGPGRRRLVRDAIEVAQLLARNGGIELLAVDERPARRDRDQEETHREDLKILYTLSLSL